MAFLIRIASSTASDIYCDIQSYLSLLFVLLFSTPILRDYEQLLKGYEAIFNEILVRNH